MSEDFDDITDGSISIDRAKHHCGRLAVDCGWRAMEVEMHIDAQAKIIAVLWAEVKEWREGCYFTDAMTAQTEKRIERVMRATDAILAQHNKRL